MSYHEGPKLASNRRLVVRPVRQGVTIETPEIRTTVMRLAKNKRLRIVTLTGNVELEHVVELSNAMRDIDRESGYESIVWVKPEGVELQVSEETLASEVS